MTGPSAPLGGTCEPRFEAVRAAFAENFSSRDEIGAALCLSVDGMVVADLWGGWRDEARQRPWERDTLVNVFSVGKAIASICVARLVGQGEFGFDDPVAARLWPEFGAAGKSQVTVRQLLSHQAGLPAVRADLPEGAVYDWAGMCHVLAAHPPWWKPGTRHGYHVNTFGFLVGEVVRRATGQSIGAMVRQQIAGPLDADFFFGVPTTELHRVAEFIGMVAQPTRTDEGLSEDQLMELHAYFNPPEFSGAGAINTTRWRMAELPSTNGHATARGIARIFDALITDQGSPGTQLVQPAVLAEATSEQVYGEDAILHRPSRFGIGFQLTQPERQLGPNPGTFGHFGAGGSLGFCDPEAKVAFGYAINTMGPRWQNPRNRALIDACYSCL
jgi:CubicO group peptidase (beta-lactamase class C family)